MTDCFFLTVFAPPMSITSTSFFLPGIRKTPLHYVKEFRRLLLAFATVYLDFVCLPKYTLSIAWLNLSTSDRIVFSSSGIWGYFIL